MKLASPYRCDSCGRLKEETNNWWLRVLPPDVGEGTRVEFKLIPWEQGSPDATYVQHICSESCAAKAFSKWMAECRTIPDGSLQDA